MSIYEIPLQPIPHQIVACVVGGQSFEITVRQSGSSLFTSTVIDGEQIAQTVRATSGGSITPWADARVGTQVRWHDSLGDEDPQYEGLGARWMLCYEGE